MLVPLVNYIINIAGEFESEKIKQSVIACCLFKVFFNICKMVPAFLGCGTHRNIIISDVRSVFGKEMRLKL
jgi:hypothetical protein